MPRTYRTNPRTRKVYPLRGGLPTMISSERTGIGCDATTSNPDHMCYKNLGHSGDHLCECYYSWNSGRATRDIPNLNQLLKRREYRPTGANEPRQFFTHTRTARELAEMRKRERE